MTLLGPRPNPETVEVLLDTTWRIADAEAARTDALDRKASVVATFSSLVATLTATLGIRFVGQFDSSWAIGLFLGGLLMLIAAVLFAVRALLPSEYVTLGTAYLRRFPTWSEIRKSPEQVRGTTMRALVQAIGQEREANAAKSQSVRRSFVLLLFGLVLISAEAAILAIEHGD